MNNIDEEDVEESVEIKRGSELLTNNSLESNITNRLISEYTFFPSQGIVEAKDWYKEVTSENGSAIGIREESLGKL